MEIHKYLFSLNENKFKSEELVKFNDLSTYV